MKAKKLSQTEKVLKHLVRYGIISTWQAIEKYKITRLSALIFQLKDLGHKIESQRIQKKDVWFVKYTLKKFAGKEITKQLKKI